MCRQDRVIGLHHCRGDLRRRINGELQFSLLPVVHRQTFHQQTRESGACPTAERVENQETLQTTAHVRDLANSVEHQVDYLLPQGVVTPGVVVRSIFFARDELLWMEELVVRSCSNFV